MANPWFRMYSEFATDPKVQMMSEADQRRFLMLLCLRCSNGDVTLQDDEIAFQLRITVDEWTQTKSTFLSKGLINEHNQPTAWDRRQFISDSSAERVRRHRAKKKQEAKRACNVTATPPDTDTDTDTEDKAAATRTRARAPAREAAAAAPPGKSKIPKTDPRGDPPPDPLHARAIEITGLLRQRGASLQASDPRLRRWAQTHITDAQLLTALETAQQRREDAANPAPINAGYLDSILADVVEKPPNARQGRFAKDLEQMAQLSAWADEEIRKASSQHPAARTEIDMGVIDARENR